MSPLDLRGRHAIERPVAPSLWHCPACNAEQTGPLEQGCTACGSGQPGKFVGVDPPARKTRLPDAGELGPPPAVVQNEIATAWLAWFRPLRGRYDAAGETIAFEAFQAGYEAAMGKVQSEAIQPLVGTPESRTIIAALKRFLEEVLPAATEEIAQGEFLSLEETRRLIERLERQG